jgi:hypothetical protein
MIKLFINYPNYTNGSFLEYFLNGNKLYWKKINKIIFKNFNLIKNNNESI